MIFEIVEAKAKSKEMVLSLRGVVLFVILWDCGAFESKWFHVLSLWRWNFVLLGGELPKREWKVQMKRWNTVDSSLDRLFMIKVMY